MRAAHSEVPPISPLIRQLAAIVLLGLVPWLPARATTYSADYTDMWWNAAENGWGLNVIQQGETLFLTLFVYGTDNAPRWYVGSAVTPTDPQPSGAVRFSGPLYRTSGPWFGGDYNAAIVMATQVGTVTVTFDSAESGTLAYTVDGAGVTKVITRYGFRSSDASGTYTGGLVATASGCTSASDNGVTYIVGTTTVAQTPGQLSLRVDFYAGQSAAVCTFTGTYAQKGRLAAVPSGNFSCSVGGTVTNAGVFSLSELDAQRNGFHATFDGRDQFCSYNGRFGGTRNPGG
jgi:hypothetical protein